MPKALIVEIFGDARQFGAELDKAAGKTQRFAAMSKVAGIAIAGGLAYGLEKSVKEAMAAQVSTERLTSTFKAAHDPISKYTGGINNAEAAGRNFGFTNLDIRDSLGTLEIGTQNGAKSIKDLAVAEDLARFKHLDLASASKVLVTAMAGSTRAAHLLGIQTTSVTTAQTRVAAAYKVHSGAAYLAALASAKLIDKQKQAALVIKLVEDRVHGQAKAFSETAAGGAARFHAEMAGLGENLGSVLLPAINKVVSALSVAASWLAEHKTLAEALVIGVGALALVMIGVSVATAAWTAVSTVATAATTTFAFALTGLGITLIAITAGIAVLALAAYEIVSHWGAVKGFFVGLWDDIKGAFSGAISWIEGHWKLFLGLPGLLWQHWGAIAGWFGKLWGSITGVFSSAIAWITNRWQAMISFLVGMIRPLVDAYNLVFGRLTGNINLPGSSGPSGPPPAHMVGPTAHAMGGLFTKPHRALVAEAGPELILPLSNPSRTASLLAGVFGSPMSSSTGGYGSAPVAVSGPSVGPIIVHGTADAEFARLLARELAVALRGGRVPELTQAIQNAGT